MNDHFKYLNEFEEVFPTIPKNYLGNIDLDNKYRFHKTDFNEIVDFKKLYLEYNDFWYDSSIKYNERKKMFDTFDFDEYHKFLNEANNNRKIFYPNNFLNKSFSKEFLQFSSKFGKGFFVPNINKTVDYLIKIGIMDYFKEDCDANIIFEKKIKEFINFMCYVIIEFIYSGQLLVIDNKVIISYDLLLSYIHKFVDEKLKNNFFEIIFEYNKKGHSPHCAFKFFFTSLILDYYIPNKNTKIEIKCHNFSIPKSKVNVINKKKGLFSFW